jgi:hypothetical protein
VKRIFALGVLVFGLAAAPVLADPGQVTTQSVGTVQVGQALDRPGTVRITDSEVRRAHVDGGPVGKSVGDLDVYTVLLYNKRIRAKALGQATMTCTAVGATGQSCTATYFLPKGTIVTQGVITSRFIYELAVVGGTGLYSNVRGSLTVTSLKRRPSRELLVFRLSV